MREDLGRQAEELRRLSGATVRPHLAGGSIVNALVSLTEFELVTVLVVGPTTRRLRNTAERVARASLVPVPVPRAPERLIAWLRDRKPLRLLVGTDLGRRSGATVRRDARKDRPDRGGGGARHLTGGDARPPRPRLTGQGPVGGGRVRAAAGAVGDRPTR